MSKRAPDEILQDLLVTLYSNIVQQASEEELPKAERAFYSIRDFSLGDTVSCNAGTALQNCELIRSCFPKDAPGSVSTNLDHVKAAIRRLENQNHPNLFNRLFFPILIVGAILIIYWIIHRRY